MFSGIVLAFELVMLTLLQSLGVQGRPVAIMGILIGVFSIAYYIDLDKNEYMKCVKNPMILGYMLRLALLIFDLYGRSIYVLPNSSADTEMFYRLGIATARGFKNDRGYFIDVLGFVFRTIGESRLYVQFLLMLLSIVALHFCDKAMRECKLEDSVRRRAMTILCLLPNFAILSSIFLRESLVTMLITISAYCFVMWVTRGHERWFLTALIFSLGASIFHSGSIAVLIGYVACRLIYDKGNRCMRITIGNIILTGLLILFGTYFLNRYSDLFLGKLRNVEGLDDIASTGQSADSSYARFVGNSDSILNMVIYTIPRIVFFLFSPMPFQWRGVSDVIAFLFSSLYYVFVIYHAISFLRNVEKEKKPLVLMLLLAALSAAFVFAWGTSNSGTAVRHRDKLFVLYGIIYALTVQPTSHVVKQQSRYIL